MDKENNFIDEESSQFFKLFLELYTEKKIDINFTFGSFALLTDNGDDTLKNMEKKEFKKFESFYVDLIKQLKRKVIFDEKVDYDEYVDKLLQTNKDLYNDIYVRGTSGLNLCDSIRYELLTRRDEDLKIKTYSTLITLNIEGLNEAKSQQTLELSISDLKKLKELAENSINDIEKLLKE